MIHITGAGSAVITASQAGNTDYSAAADVPQTLVVNKANQTITFNALPVKVFGDVYFNPGATASSGLTVSYSRDNQVVTTIVGGLIYITGAGSAVITASQAGDANFNPAPDVLQTLTVNKANQIIAFNALPVKIFGDAVFNPGASTSSALTVNFSSDNSAVAIIVGGMIYITGAGTAVITASQTGNGNYNPAPVVLQTLTVNKGNLNFTADNISKEFQAQNPVLTYLISGFVNGETQSILDALPTIQTTAVQNSPVGSYPITITGGSDNNYNYSYIPGTLTVTKIPQTITFTDIVEKLLVDESYTLVATSTSGFAVLFESMDTQKATVSGDKLTGVSKGTVQIRAYNPGDENYDPAEVFATVEIYSTHKDIMHLFTPNNDGFNDLWELPDLATWGKCDVKVYNRWGKLVFADADYNNQWDGTSNGSPLPEGPYYFVIKTENAGMIKGTVNIVR
jgi:gliding motility-associated-like protein